MSKITSDTTSKPKTILFIDLDETLLAHLPTQTVSRFLPYFAPGVRLNSLARGQLSDLPDFNPTHPLYWKTKALFKKQYAPVFKHINTALKENPGSYKIVALTAGFMSHKDFNTFLDTAYPRESGESWEALTGYIHASDSKKATAAAAYAKTSNTNPTKIIFIDNKKSNVDSFERKFKETYASLCDIHALHCPSNDNVTNPRAEIKKLFKTLYTEVGCPEPRGVLATIQDIASSGSMGLQATPLLLTALLATLAVCAAEAPTLATP